MIEDATGRVEGATVGMAEVSPAHLHNGRGNHDAALTAAAAACEHDESAYGSVAVWGS